jgi:CBS domain-containing protein
MQKIQKTISEFLAGRALPRLEPGATVAAALEHLRSAGGQCVLVTEGETLVGIFTERDFVFRVAAEDRDPSTTALADVMTGEPETLRPEDCISYAINRMAVRGFRNVPIVDDGGRLVGLLSVRDVMSHLREVFAELEETEVVEDRMEEWVDIGGGG